MKVFGFDLGNTLLEYEGVPLNWEQQYPAALTELARCLAVQPTSTQIEQGCAVLRRFNTRLNPREHEIAFRAILSELGPCLGAGEIADEQRSAEAFFRVFQQQLRPFADSAPALAALRARRLKIGVLTDVPYGMPRSLVVQDVNETGLRDLIDVLLTSCETGCRKPSGEGLRSLAHALGCSAAEMAYVGDEPKDIEAARRFGCRAILLDRRGRGVNFGQNLTIGSLLELA